MKRCLSWAVVGLILFCFPGRGLAQFFPAPDLKGEEVSSYVFKPKETTRFYHTIWGVNIFNKTAVRISNRIEETPQGKKLEMTMQGRDEKTGGETIIHNSFLVVREGLKQIAYDKKSVDLKSGEVFYQDEIRFDKQSGIYPPNSYTAETFFLCMRGLDFKSKQRLKFYWVNSDWQVLPFYTKIKPPEEITVSAGKFLCRRVEIWPDMTSFTRFGNFMFKLVSPFIPATCFYIAEEPPHQLIAFEGPAVPGAQETFGELVKKETPAGK